MSGGNLILKVLGKEFEDYSPLSGEMAAMLPEGTGSRWENPFSKGFSSIIAVKSPVKVQQ